ncbi:Os04g0405401 [Oryza sativa Japonica Group]|uniref:Os04g0405401 protein n=2 Tax=Oryza sativa subsp. japonica TaxID=39947 RepID=B9FF06_ORYSJ|nr:hypothetical protein OsJ_14689 [Oryza sativa Japonica Group]BAS89076.1 Os04g0405401 [Oryza sativa Japonica Group]
MRIAADELRRQGIAHKLKFYVLQQFNDESICASYAAIGCLCDCSTSALLSSGYGGRKGSTCLSSYSSRYRSFCPVCLARHCATRSNCICFKAFMVAPK